MDNLRNKFGVRLRTLRIQRQMTQEQLAAAANISVDFLSLVERGKNSPAFPNIESLAKALRIPVKELFKFDEE